ncbi:3-phosphoglycerate dehydrogenase family protein [Vagococcus entomophilus]|uniref:D-3-phosphoglycerate dehydrogenase n=1 Tax=Vagococcus entomophilus TaxID=1160095 RepID=A0A430AFX2_9ENTE|nr:3-phosphoglycerate dehydrogenase family protein [Vagococcus entomophilus]RSU06622.1 3-phosphoglycerate dehydrogenase [Vagococcus entomophilus]
MSYDIQTFNAIAKEGLARLPEDCYTLNQTQHPDAILLRSQKLHDTKFSKSIKGIARAGAGTNNIPVDRCTKEGIVVFNTPGANANAVKELVLANLFLAVRPILSGANWVQTLSGPNTEEQAEAHKKQFAGTELEGKKLGVIGLGAIGAMVANDAYRLGMDVVGYDPFVSVDTAWSISRHVHRALNIEEVLSSADFITIHVPLTEKTKHLIGKKELSLLQSHAVLLNFARGELVDAQALLEILEQDGFQKYVTDFADEKLLHHEKILVLPHLGASTQEAETNCAIMAATTLANFLETGNIRHSVNFPTVEISFHSPFRLAIVHQNVPNMLGAISTVVAELGYNIDNLINRSREEIAYTLVDLTVTNEQAKHAEKKIQQLEHILSTRLIQNLT